MIDKTSTLQTFHCENKKVKKETDGNICVDVKDDLMNKVNDKVITTEIQPTILEKTYTFQSVSSENNMKTKVTDVNKGVDMEDSEMKVVND